MNNYELSAQLCEKLKSTELDVNKELTFEALRKTSQQFFKVVENERGVVARMKADAEANYAGETLSEKLAELNKPNTNHKTMKEFLLKKLDEVVTAKRKQLTSFTLQPVDDELRSILETARLRADKLSDVELEMLIDRCGTNYTGLSIVQDIAEKKGKLFVIPFDPTEMTERLDIAEASCKRYIDEIDSDNPTFHTITFLTSDALLPWSNGIDDNPALAVPNEKPTLYERYEDAIADATEKGDLLRIKHLRDKKAELESMIDDAPKGEE